MSEEIQIDEEKAVLQQANEDLQEQNDQLRAELKAERQARQEEEANNRELERKLRRAKKRRRKSARVPTLLAVGLAVVSAALCLATMHGMAIPGFGFFLAAAAAVGCALFCGITYERTRE